MSLYVDVRVVIWRPKAGLAELPAYMVIPKIIGLLIAGELYGPFSALVMRRNDTLDVVEVKYPQDVEECGHVLLEYYVYAIATEAANDSYKQKRLGGLEEAFQQTIQPFLGKLKLGDRAGKF